MVLITGASSGIGAACAERLGHSGWTVVGASRRGTAPAVARAMRMDVDDDASVSEGVAAVVARHGRVDAVVACAGWGLAGAVERTPIEDARAQLETNFWGSVRVVQAVLPVMRRQGRGRIVLVSSIGGVVGLPFQAFYSAGKFAIEGFGEALALEVAPFGIDVTLLEPGNLRTGFTAARRGLDVSSRAAPRDPYAVAAARAVGRMERDERRGPPPEVAARTVERVLRAARPPRRVTVGASGERLVPAAKRLLPGPVFERLARRGLGL